MDRNTKLSSIIYAVSGIAELWKGIHDQVDNKPQSCTELKTK